MLKEKIKLQDLVQAGVVASVKHLEKDEAIFAERRRSMRKFIKQITIPQNTIKLSAVYFPL